MEASEAALKLPRPLCALLVARGFGRSGGRQGFLRPILSGLHPPDDLPDLPKAVIASSPAIRQRRDDPGPRRLRRGRDGRDGPPDPVAGEAGRPGRSPSCPTGCRDGYDLGPAGLEAAVSAGASLLVTVDCGILAHDAVEEARALGIDVIVTDHHAPGQDLPAAIAVLNPGSGGQPYPNPDLCGAGVAFKLCQGLAEAEGIAEEELHPFLDLVGLATVADLVPLKGENRILARYGLKALAQTSNLGLRALMAEAGVARGRGLRRESRLWPGAPPECSWAAGGTPGWPESPPDGGRERPGPGPRAGGGEPGATGRRSKNPGGGPGAVGREFDPETDFGVVLESEDWHPGVVGIVASRVVERIHRPAILIALEGDGGRGSARSIPEFHLLEGIRACGSLLERFGGHRQAAGMEIQRDRIPEFREAFNQRGPGKLEGKDLRPTPQVEVEVRLEEMSEELLRYLKYLGPHGIGNPGPSFLARGVTLSGAARIVGTDHLKLRLRQGADASWTPSDSTWPDGCPSGELGAGPVDVVFQLQENEFRGVRRLQARLKDIRPTGSGLLALGASLRP